MDVETRGDVAEDFGRQLRQERLRGAPIGAKTHIDAVAPGELQFIFVIRLEQHVGSPPSIEAGPAADCDVDVFDINAPGLPRVMVALAATGQAGGIFLNAPGLSRVMVTLAASGGRRFS